MKGNTCMVWEHYMIVLLTNHISAFYMGLCNSGGFYIKYTYMIGREHNYVVLPDLESLSHGLCTKK